MRPTDQEFWDASAVALLRTGLAPDFAARQASVMCDLRAERIRREEAKWREGFKSLWLVAVDARRKVDVIKALRHEFTIPLVRAKELSESTPVLLIEAWPPDRVERVKRALEEAGATVEIRAPEV